MILTLLTQKNGQHGGLLCQRKKAQKVGILIVFFQGLVNGILINESSVYGTLCIILLKNLIWGFILVKSTQGASLIGDEAFDFLLIIPLPQNDHLKSCVLHMIVVWPLSGARMGILRCFNNVSKGYRFNIFKFFL